jgi:hypothetical protein
MQFSNLSITALFALLATSVVAAPADSFDVRSADAAPNGVYADEIAKDMVKRGFGCPGDETACHNHVSEPLPDQVAR